MILGLSKLRREHFTFATSSPQGLCLCSRAFRRQAAGYKFEMLPLRQRVDLLLDEPAEPSPILLLKFFLQPIFPSNGTALFVAASYRNGIS